MKHEITATYKPNPGETYQVTVRATSGYPDAMAEARAQAVRAIDDMLANVLGKYGVETSDQASDD